GLLCALPYILPASGLFRDMRINASGLEDSFSARLPAVVSFTDISQYRFFLVFAFIAPLIANFVKRPLPVKLLTLIAIWLAIAGTDPIISGFSAVWFVTFCSALLLNWVFFLFGLFSEMVTIMASQAAVTAGSLLAQPNASFQASGWRVIGGLAIVSLF